MKEVTKVLAFSFSQNKLNSPFLIVAAKFFRCFPPNTPILIKSSRSKDLVEI